MRALCMTFLPRWYQVYTIILYYTILYYTIIVRQLQMMLN